MGKLESRLVSLRDSWTYDLMASLSVILAKASSSWIASLSQFLDRSRNIALNCGLRAVAAKAAQRAACIRHSLGSPGMTSLRESRSCMHVEPLTTSMVPRRHPPRALCDHWPPCRRKLPQLHSFSASNPSTRIAGQFQLLSHLHQRRIPVAPYRFRWTCPVDLKIASRPNRLASSTSSPRPRARGVLCGSRAALRTFGTDRLAGGGR